MTEFVDRNIKLPPDVLERVRAAASDPLTGEVDPMQEMNLLLSTAAWLPVAEAFLKEQALGIQSPQLEPSQIIELQTILSGMNIRVLDRPPSKGDFFMENIVRSVVLDQEYEDLTSKKMVESDLSNSDAALLELLRADRLSPPEVRLPQEWTIAASYGDTIKVKVNFYRDLKVQEVEDKNHQIAIEVMDTRTDTYLSLEGFDIRLRSQKGETIVGKLVDDDSIFFDQVNLAETYEIEISKNL